MYVFLTASARSTQGIITKNQLLKKAEKDKLNFKMEYNVNNKL